MKGCLSVPVGLVHLCCRALEEFSDILDVTFSSCIIQIDHIAFSSGSLEVKVEVREAEKYTSEKTHFNISIGLVQNETEIKPSYTLMNTTGTPQAPAPASLRRRDCYPVA